MSEQYSICPGCGDASNLDDLSLMTIGEETFDLCKTCILNLDMIPNGPDHTIKGLRQESAFLFEINTTTTEELWKRWMETVLRWSCGVAVAFPYPSSLQRMTRS